MRVTFATAEYSPIATVGGLAAASAGLVDALRRAGIDVDVVLPDYTSEDKGIIETIELHVPLWAGPATAKKIKHRQAGEITLIDAPGLAKSHPYLQPDGNGWLDNTDRFMRFSAAVAAFVRHTSPDVVHLNDWHTATALADLDPTPPSVLSLHNLAHQGAAGREWLDLIGPKSDHYEWWDEINPLAGAIALADHVVAVSPHHATEIVEDGNGFGLDVALQAKGSALTGILNGIDTTVWNPEHDRCLPAAFSAADHNGKILNREHLVNELGLTDDDSLLAVAVTRLTDQKGIDLLLPLINLLDEIPLRLAVLGSGDRILSEQLAAAANNADRFTFVDGYDEGLSHRLIAAGDLFLMPSRFEPCGLTQMQAMRYGTIPIVTPVGGLVDTVVDLDTQPREGRGFVMDDVSSTALISAVHRAVRKCRGKQLENIRTRIMSVDWSWDAPAKEFIKIYQQISR
ncbi:MAG: glycogen/starch synthase [Actinomycetota bacterium]|nr:glycogen/starch synthase [Actinomycetota bacterium]